MTDSNKIFNKNKKYLLTNYHKLNYPKGSELIFIDEILFNLYSAKDKSAYKSSYIHSIDNALKIRNSINIIQKKKLKTYKREFTKLLNTYHKIYNSEKYWGLIIHQFLIILLEAIILEIKLFKKIKINNFFTIHENINIEKNFQTNDFINYTLSSNFKRLLSLSVLKELDAKLVNLKYKSSDKINIKNKEKFYKIIIRLALSLYIYLAKPIIIVDGYIGWKNTIRFFFNSFGKILNVPKSLFFSEVNNNLSIDHDFRTKIKVSEKDIIDRIFNKIVGRILPSSFLENFYSIQENFKSISKKIKIISTGNCHYYSDYFNILTAEILKNKSCKLLTFQHGGCISQTNRLVVDLFEQNYAFKSYNFDNTKGLGQHFFNQKKISTKEIEERKIFLILNTNVNFERDIMYLPSSYIHYDPSLVFFSNLDQSKKKKFLLKLFPEKNSIFVKKFWQKKFGKQINFLPIFCNAKNKNFYNAKIVILNDISTALWELLFQGLPFILICNHQAITARYYKDSFKSKFMKLKKINILFEDGVQAANFINSFDEEYSIDDWWKKTIKTKIFLDFKETLIVEKDNYLPKIIKELKQLNK